LGLSSDTVSSRIFIGAKLGDSKRDQEIKGVLVHELCHYVMCLVYDNKFLPYYKHATDIRDKFDVIVKSIDKWSANDPDPPGDECGGIISSVFRYKKLQFNLEMIVRAVQILVMYDDDPEHSAYLQEKFQELFDFWFTQVVPEMHKYLHKNKFVIRINATVELLPSLSKSKIEFSTTKNVEQLTKNKITIVTTNVPRLLFINIHKQLQENFGCLLDSQNIFIEPEKIKNVQVWKDLMHLLAKDVNLNIFVDCTNGYLNNLSSIIKFEEFKLILVASNEEQSIKLNSICIKKESKPITVDINYNWNDLTEESQIMLIQSKITFQTNPKISLIDLLSKNMNPDRNEVEKIIDDFSSTINDHVFNLLVDRQKISINSNADDSNKIKFGILFRNRNFLNKGINFKNEFSQEKLISVTANNKYVLISDIAGSGKSWVVKNISKIIMKQNPTRWVTYVDLKQFIENFKKQHENFEFSNFFILNILKTKTKFEAEIFKKLYKIGKVSIIFDAFDEIAPDCAEFVADLAKSFEFNDGNQLWIVTRDYFEVNLQRKLGIFDVYKLNEFTEDDGVNFIVVSWILMDLNDPTVNDFENFLQNSPNLTKYQDIAKKIVQKVATTKNQSIGLPQLFSMIADGFKDDKVMLDDMKRAKIFTHFVNTMYTRWADFKGILRKQASVQSQDYELNFKELHQFYAILSLFPELVDELFPDYDISEWPEVEIIAGGLLNKIGSNYSFNHETFREYFVADFIFKAIKKPRIKKQIVNLLIKVLTIQKYGIIRMFLNDFIDNPSIMEKAQLELEKSVEKFNNMENLSDYFTENLEHFAKCVIKILKKGNYENVNKILNENINAVATKTRELKMFSTFTEFLFSYLRLDDLKDMINSQKILHKIIGSGLDAEIFEYFVMKLEEKVGREFIQHELKLMSSRPSDGNIFYHLGKSQNLSENKVKKCFQIFQKYLTDSEIVELVEKCKQDEQTVLRILVENTKNFKPFLEGSKYFFTNQNMVQKFKNIVNKTDSNGQHILHWSAGKEGIDFHTSLWKLILKTFEDHLEFGTFVLQKSELEDNFLHLLLIDTTSETIEFTLNKLKETLRESNYEEILRSKGKFKRNLLQVAAVNSKEVKTHQILWKTIRDFCKSNDEFLEILGQIDEDGNNVFHLAAAFNISEVFEFIIAELEKAASSDEKQKIFSKLGHENQNVLQSAAIKNKSLELHEALWEIFRKYFNSSGILEFIKYCDIYGNNLLINVIKKNTKEVAEWTWKEVKELLNTNGLIIENHKENIQKCEKIMKNISRTNKLQRDESEILKLKWIKHENSEASKLFDEEIQRLLEQNLNNIKFENLQYFMADENVKNHEKLWENLIKTYKNRGDLKKLLFEKDIEGDNFIYLLVIYNTADVIEFTINKFKENLSESDYHEFLRSKARLGRNLLQLAACYSTEVKTHQILWKTLRVSCKSDVEFLKILQEVDRNGSNFFGLTATFTTGEIFKFIQKEFEKIALPEEIKKLLKNLGFARRSLMQAAAKQNKSLELHEAVWEIIEKYFDSSEILQFIKHRDICGWNVLLNAIEKNTKEVKDLAWNKVKKNLINIGYEDNDNFKKCDEIIKKDKDIDELTKEEKCILKLDWIDSRNTVKLFEDNNIELLMQKEISDISLDDLMPFIANENVKNHEIIWKYLENGFESYEELKKLLFEKDRDGNNFIHNLVIYNTADVIEITLNKLKENFSESDYLENLRSKGEFGRNLLQHAAFHSKEVKTHQILWKTFRDFCNSDEEFLDFLREVYENRNNIFHLAAAFATSEVFEFMIAELEKLTSYKETRKCLTSFGQGNSNLLQSVATQNRSLETNKTVWKLMCKYFDAEEILKFIKYCDKYGNNLFCNSVFHNTIEIVQFTWIQIKTFILTKDAQVEYLNKTGHESENLHQLSLKNQTNDSQVALWVQKTLKEYAIN